MTIVDLDFEGVETGAGYLPAGQYRARVQSIELKEGQKADYLNWCFVSEEPGTEGMVAYLKTSLSSAALWKLKSTLEALGAEIPQSKVRLDTGKFLGRVGIIHVADEPYVGSDGVSRSSFKIQDVWRATDAEPAAPLEPPNDFSDVDFGGDDGSISF